MCGIVGMVNGRSVAQDLIHGLRNLEYRGYDSAGIAIAGRSALSRLRASGPLDSLAAAHKVDPIDGPSGIGHTRWATHGAPTEQNAHPHFADGVAVVHNGIIENHAALRARLREDGVAFNSDTDSEVVPHLIASYRKAGLSRFDAIREATQMLEGQFALGILFEDEPRTLYAARRESPLAIGAAPKAVMLASDMLAYAGRAEQTLALESDEIARIRRDGVQILNGRGETVDRAWTAATSTAVTVHKAGHRHFMHKEIFEQPEAIAKTFAATAAEEVAAPVESVLADCNRLSIVACGTSYYAGMAARPWLERYAGMAVDLDVASEFRYRDRPCFAGTGSLYISQSGETADSLACMRDAKEKGEKTAAIVNVPTSAMANEADVTIPTLAGPEIGVASTKAFTAQLAALMGLARSIGKARAAFDPEMETRFETAYRMIPALIEDVLDREGSCETVARAIKNSKSAIFLGRGANHALAMEGALKLKEISYIHAEGFAAGELKHGPIALIDEAMPVIVVAPRDGSFAKTASNVEEVAARHGKIILLSDEEGCDHLAKHCWHQVVLPETDDLTAPFVYAVALQFIAYHTALALGTDVDRPRNLAKSVTVE